VLPENPRRTRLVGTHQPAVAGDIGGQYGSKSALDAVLPRSGHGGALWAVFYTERRQSWMKLTATVAGLRNPAAGAFSTVPSRGTG
jgi:hypothetical protein